MPSASFSSNSQMRWMSPVGMTAQRIARALTEAPETAEKRLRAFQALAKMYRNGRKPEITMSETMVW